MSPETTVSTPETLGDGAFLPLTVEEARALITEAPAEADRDALLAERAEAEAQLRAAEATLGSTAPGAAGNGQGDGEQEREEPAQNPHHVDVREEVDGWLDIHALREAAAAARAADDELARAASEAAERPPSGPPNGSAAEGLGSAESALARALELREELPAAWRRLVGALISATGMAIVIGALGWNVYWLLVPIALIAIMTVDLRLAGKAAREASAEAAGDLTAVGVAGPDVLEHMRRQREGTEEAEARLAAARADRDAAYDRFEELAPGRLPSEVEEIIAEYEAELAEKREAAEARAEAEAAAQAEAEAAARAEAEAAPADTEASEAETDAARAETEAEVEAETAPAETEAPDTEAPDTDAVEKADEAVSPVPGPAAAAAAATGGDKPVAAEWWFGSKEPPPVPAAASGSVRALAERLSAEGREALARIEAQLAALDRVEHAKKSLEWHEQNGSTEPAGESPAETA